MDCLIYSAQMSYEIGFTVLINRKQLAQRYKMACAQSNQDLELGFQPKQSDSSIHFKLTEEFILLVKH